MREVLPEGEGWIKQGGSVWTGRGGDGGTEYRSTCMTEVLPEGKGWIKQRSAWTGRGGDFSALATPRHHSI